MEQNLGVSTAVRTRLRIQVSTQGKDVEPAVEVDMAAGAQVGVLLTAHSEVTLPAGSDGTHVPSRSACNIRSGLGGLAGATVQCLLRIPLPRWKPGTGLPPHCPVFPPP